MKDPQGLTRKRKTTGKTRSRSAKRSRWEEGTPGSSDLGSTVENPPVDDEMTTTRLDQLKIDYADAVTRVRQDQQERRHSAMSSDTLRASEISNAWASRKVELTSDGYKGLKYLAREQEPHLMVIDKEVEQEPHRMAIDKVVKQTPAEKLVWELLFKTIPTFNGERDAALIVEFQKHFSRAVKGMKKLRQTRA
jgi:hypothetical protein